MFKPNCVVFSIFCAVIKPATTAVFWERIPESSRLFSQLLEPTCAHKASPAVPVVDHLLIFDWPACSQLLMLIVVGADSKGDDCPEWTSVPY